VKAGLIMMEKASNKAGSMVIEKEGRKHKAGVIVCKSVTDTIMKGILPIRL
jgi:hypothetical protein